jgi:hypothetical protein
MRTVIYPNDSTKYTEPVIAEIVLKDPATGKEIFRAGEYRLSPGDSLHYEYDGFTFSGS